GNEDKRQGDAEQEDMGESRGCVARKKLRSLAPPKKQTPGQDAPHHPDHDDGGRSGEDGVRQRAEKPFRRRLLVQGQVLTGDVRKISSIEASSAASNSESITCRVRSSVRAREKLAIMSWSVARRRQASARV